MQYLDQIVYVFVGTFKMASQEPFSFFLDFLSEESQYVVHPGHHSSPCSWNEVGCKQRG